MRLKLHETGDGDRTAVLVHSLISSAQTWYRVAPELAARGYRVVMPDLRGHGESPHADAYRPEDFADDLVDSLPSGADLVLGHSLGAAVLSLAVPALRPARVVYCDPAWRFTEKSAAEVKEFARFTKAVTADALRTMFPRWDEPDIEAELAGYAQSDTRALDWLDAAVDFVPAKPSAPTLVLGAGDHHLVPDDLAERLRGAGFEVRYVEGAGHAVHRDDLAGFFAALEGWI